MAIIFNETDYDRSANPPVPNVQRNTDFTVTIGVEGDDGEVIDSISIVGVDQDPGVTVTAGSEDVTIAGNYQAAYPNDRGKYVFKGSSDKLMVPIVVNSTAAIPPNEDLFSWLQDDTAFVDKEYTVTVEFTDSEDEPGTEVLSLLHRVINDWSSGTAFLKDYFGT